MYIMTADMHNKWSASQAFHSLLGRTPFQTSGVTDIVKLSYKNLLCGRADLNYVNAFAHADSIFS